MRDLMQVLSNNGVSKLTAEVGQKLDPNQHEAMFDVPIPDAEPGSIAVIVKVRHLLKASPLSAYCVLSTCLQAGLCQQRYTVRWSRHSLEGCFASPEMYEGMRM